MAKTKKGGVVEPTKVEFEKDNRTKPETTANQKGQRPTTKSNTKTIENFFETLMDENTREEISEHFNFSQRYLYEYWSNSMTSTTTDFDNYPQTENWWPFIVHTKRSFRDKEYYEIDLKLNPQIIRIALEKKYGPEIAQTGLLEAAKLDQDGILTTDADIELAGKYFDDFKDITSIRNYFLPTYKNDLYVPLLSVDNMEDRILLITLTQENEEEFENSTNGTLSSKPYKPLTTGHFIDYAKKLQNPKMAKRLIEAYNTIK